MTDTILARACRPSSAVPRGRPNGRKEYTTQNVAVEASEEREQRIVALVALHAPMVKLLKGKS